MVDVAPHAGLTRELRKRNSSMFTLDRDPVADGREVDLIGDATALPFDDSVFGLVICSHVLEHIADDMRAMSELVRVLHRRGIGLILTPRRSGRLTDEDPSAAMEERVRRFGQADHVRIYGDDLEDRFHRAGLHSRLVRASDLPEACLAVIGIHRDIQAWLVAADEEPPQLETSELVKVVADRIAAGLAAQERRTAEAHAEAKEWQDMYQWLESRAAVRLGKSLRHLLGR